MPYVKQANKIGVGISFDPDTLRRIDALVDGGGRKRSAFISELIVAGLVHQIGPDWFIQADRILAKEEKAEAA